MTKIYKSSEPLEGLIPTEKSFLDYEGVKHLWSKINMQDYPNNEMLISIINAIDETKADKTEIIQSNWNENDETSTAYIQNRTHYQDIKEQELFNEIINFEYDDFEGTYSARIDNPGFLFETNKVYNIILNGQKYQNLIGESNIVFVGIGDYFYYDPFYIATHADNNFLTITTTLEIIDTTLSIFEVEKDFKQLDEIFIPNTIARIDEIPSIDGLATEEYVNTSISEFSATGEFSGLVINSSLQSCTLDENCVLNDISITNIQTKITGTAGQFVVIGNDGNVTTKTIPYAEEASF